jgi:hypothetical protein
MSAGRRAARATAFLLLAWTATACTTSGHDPRPADGQNNLGAGGDAGVLPPPEGRPAFADLGPDPCPALRGALAACGVSLPATYVTDCRSNFSGSDPASQAFQCAEQCLYGAASDPCSVIRAREDGRACVTCCAPLRRGHPPTCGAPPAALDAAPVDVGSPGVGMDAGAAGVSDATAAARADASSDGPSCVRQFCTDELFTCASTTGCTGLLDCLAPCTTDACSADCRARFPDEAATALDALLACNKQHCT